MKDFFPPPEVGAALGGNQQEMAGYLLCLWKGGAGRGWDPGEHGSANLQRFWGETMGTGEEGQALCPGPTCYVQPQASENAATQKPGMQAGHGTGN